jgi:tetratricopeptide (TPR) repeat protein
LQQGNGDEALALFNDAVRILLAHQDPQVLSAMVIRAEALKATNKPHPSFEHLNLLPKEAVSQIMHLLVARLGRTNPLWLSRVLAEFYPLALRTLGPQHAQLPNLLTAMANLEGDLGFQGDPKRRREVIQQLIDLHEAASRPRDALQARLGLALAQSDANDPDGAVATYRDLIDRAQRQSDLRMVARGRRELGLLLAEVHKPNEAEPLLRQAFTNARATGDQELIGRNGVALGVFLQHQKQLQEARSLLSESSALLPQTHSDVALARAHLQALDSGQSCTCEANSRAAIAETFLSIIQEKMPPGSIAKVDVKIIDKAVHVEATTTRELNESERLLLQQLVDGAQKTLQVWNR